MTLRKIACPLVHSLVVVLLFGLSCAVKAAAQDCRSSLNVDVNKVVVLSAWDGSQNTTTMSCGDAELAREKLFVNQLSFLSDTQQNSAAQISQVISDAVGQLDQLRGQLQAANSNEVVATLSLTVQGVKWQVAKAKLLLCGLEAAGSDGLGLAVCAPQLWSFLKSSDSTFKALNSVDDAHQEAAQLQTLITSLQTEIGQLGSATIDGSATAQKYATTFNLYCSQIKQSCMSDQARVDWKRRANPALTAAAHSSR